MRATPVEAVFDGAARPFDPFSQTDQSEAAAPSAVRLV